MSNPTIPRLLKSAIAAGAILGLGGCMYGGTGYYGDGYVNHQRYDCDPYAPFNDYYACDYGYGFANIGYGGGWYDQYYCPGYGIYIFDRGGRRLAMRDNHRRYWARQRAEYGGHRARDRNRYPERRMERRDQRYDRGDGIRDQRRGSYRNDGNVRYNGGTRDQRGNQSAPGAGRPDNTGQAPPVRNRADRGDRRPTMAIEQPQARPQAPARPAQVSPPTRPEGPRYSPRTSRSERERISDD